MPIAGNLLPKKQGWFDACYGNVSRIHTKKLHHKKMRLKLQEFLSNNDFSEGNHYIKDFELQGNRRVSSKIFELQLILKEILEIQGILSYRGFLKETIDI